jgi:hypothetical protein
MIKTMRNLNEDTRNCFSHFELSDLKESVWLEWTWVRGQLKKLEALVHRKLVRDQGVQIGLIFAFWSIVFGEIYFIMQPLILGYFFRRKRKQNLFYESGYIAADFLQKTSTTYARTYRRKMESESPPLTCTLSFFFPRFSAFQFFEWVYKKQT